MKTWIIGRGGDLDDRATAVVKPCDPQTDTYRVGVLLNRFHRLPGPGNIQWGGTKLSYTKVSLHGGALSVSDQ